MSSTAKAGGEDRTDPIASATVPTSRVSKPRLSKARPRRVRKAASSSSNNRLLSGKAATASAKSSMPTPRIVI